MKSGKYVLAVMLGAIAILAPRGARADELYQFNIDAFQINAGTPTQPLIETINAFTFSFTVPTFIASGDTPAITPFSITDGTTTWTFNQMEATTTIGGNACFLAATTGASFLSFDTCGFSVQVTPGDGAAAFLLSVPLPTADGTYTLSDSSGTLIVPPSPGLPSDVAFTGDLVVSQTSGSGGSGGGVTTAPEPSSLLLVATGLLGLIGMGLRAKRLA